MYQQTVCFLRRNDELLMLNRENKPTQGLWNGVGGKIEADETPLESVRREIEEETGIVLSETQITYKGMVTWEVDGTYSGGMYAFLADLPSNLEYATPRRIAEGILDWKPITWLLADRNLGVGEMIPHFLPVLLETSSCLKHKCMIQDKKLIHYDNDELPVE